MSKHSSTFMHPPTLTSMQRIDWMSLCVVLVVAMSLRLIFYTGFFGSDEVTYIDTAARIAAGDWRASDYIGATRYGMNLPVAIFIFLFGLSEASANAWTLFCSLGEVALVFVIARWLWSTRAAVVSAGLLALLPIHVQFAGRMMADPPLALFLTLSVALVLRAAYTKSGLTSLAAGLAWGGVFWVKESVGLLYAPVFLLIIFYLNGFNSLRFWLLVSLGMALALAANFLLMYWIADNPMHVFSVMKKAVIQLGGVTTLSESPWFYLNYLFVDIRHTFLLGPLVAIGIVFHAKHSLNTFGSIRNSQFVIVWVLLLWGMFSFAIVSFTPVKLVMKQTNYMLIFVAPMALLAGWWMASLPRRVFAPLVALLVCGSVVLAALEQQAVTVFTANSRAAYAYLADHPNTFLLGSANNLRAVNFYSMIENRPEVFDRMSSLGDIVDTRLDGVTSKLSTRSANKEVIALIDLQNVAWGNRRNTIKQLSDVPACWVPVGTLTPAPLGAGHWIVQTLMSAGVLLPSHLQQRYLSALQPVATPATGHLFKVDMTCVKTS